MQTERVESRGFSFNPGTILHGQMFHDTEAFMPAAYLWPTFLSVYIFDSKNGVQDKPSITVVQTLDVHLMPQFTKMLHKLNL